MSEATNETLSFTNENQPKEAKSNPINNESKLLIKYLKQHDINKIYVFDFTHLTFEEKCAQRDFLQLDANCQICEQQCDDDSSYYCDLQLINTEYKKYFYNQATIFVCNECTQEHFYYSKKEEENIQLIWAEFKNSQIAISQNYYDAPLVKNPS